MGVDISGGMIIGANSSDVEQSVTFEDDGCTLYGTQGNYYEEFYKWHESEKMSCYSMYYDACSDGQIIGYTVKDINPLSDEFTIWLEAVKQPVSRINKYCIDGEILTNKQIFEKFGINPRSANSRLNRLNKDLRATLQYYNIDTSTMTIYPCDGKIVMYNNPI